jgi:heat-inducible transcriptional repressor
MVVIITSTGGVSKRVFTFSQPVDPGLVAWAADELNGRLVGVGLGARTLKARLAGTGLSATERAFLDALTPAFTALLATAEDALYVDGTARLLQEHRLQDLSQINDLMEMLERRVTLLGVLQAVLSGAPRGGWTGDVLVRIGAENDVPALQGLTMVAAGYGLPARKLGAVSVIGPRSLDYPGVIRSVRDAATQLSRFIEDVYDL